jgi:hypothetical protein
MGKFGKCGAGSAEQEAERRFVPEVWDDTEVIPPEVRPGRARGGRRMEIRV